MSLLGASVLDSDSGSDLRSHSVVFLGKKLCLINSTSLLSGVYNILVSSRRSVSNFLCYYSLLFLLSSCTCSASGLRNYVRMDGQTDNHMTTKIFSSKGYQIFFDVQKLCY